MKRFIESESRAQATLGTKDLTVLADRGYFSGEEILKVRAGTIRALVML